jgi:hypothetical protein
VGLRESSYRSFMDPIQCATRSIANGQWSEAAALLEQVYAREQHGTDTWAVATSMLGECFTRLGRFEEAQPLLEESHAVLMRGHGSPAWRESVRRLVDHWQLRGFLERAADLHVELVMDDRRRALMPPAGGTRSEGKPSSRDQHGETRGDQGENASWLDGWSEVPQE